VSEILKERPNDDAAKAVNASLLLRPVIRKRYDPR